MKSMSIAEMQSVNAGGLIRDLFRYRGKYAIKCNTCGKELGWKQCATSFGYYSLFNQATGMTAQHIRWGDCSKFNASKWNWTIYKK